MSWVQQLLGLPDLIVPPIHQCRLMYVIKNDDHLWGEPKL